MSKFSTCNGLVAVEPFPSQSVEKAYVGRLALASQKLALQALKVVLPYNSKYEVGSTVYVKGDLYVQAWAKEVHEIDGHKFILLPEQYIQLVKTDGPYT